MTADGCVSCPAGKTSADGAVGESSCADDPTAGEGGGDVDLNAQQDENAAGSSRAAASAVLVAGALLAAAMA